MGSRDKDIKRRTFQVLVPKRVSKSSTPDLQVSLVALQNSIVSMTIYATQIERELTKRNIPTSITKATRKPISDTDILDYLENPESATAL